MTLMKINPDGRWKLDTTKMLKIILKTKDSWLKCFHPLFPQICFEGPQPITGQKSLPERKMAEEPKERFYFQFSAASKLHFTAQIFFQNINIICLRVIICSFYCTQTFAMWNLTPVRQHILMHKAFLVYRCNFQKLGIEKFMMFT